MDDDTPMFTMVKSQTLGEPPAALSEKSQGLLETLSMLCSFHTAEDLASFLYSPMFVELAQQGEVWLGFEIGFGLGACKYIQTCENGAVCTQRVWGAQPIKVQRMMQLGH